MNTQHRAKGIERDREIEGDRGKGSDRELKRVGEGERKRTRGREWSFDRFASLLTFNQAVVKT